MKENWVTLPQIRDKAKKGISKFSHPEKSTPPQKKSDLPSNKWC